MKGSVFDLPIIAIMLLVGGLSIIVVYVVLSSFTAAIPTGVTGSTEALGVLNSGKAAFTAMDTAFLLLGVGLCLVSVISAFYINSHPAFFIFSIIGLVVVILINTMVANVFNEFATNSAIVAYANDFSFMVLFMQNLPVISLVFGIMIAILTHAKPGGGSV